MKKLTTLTVLCMVIALTISKLNSSKSEISALLLDNIEALATDENTGNVYCAENGSLDCPRNHTKVAYVGSGYSLD